MSTLAEVIREKGNIPRIADSESDPVAPAIAIDPVCGMEVEVSGARQVIEYNGVRYYFCCPGCKGRFEKRPEKFVAA